MLPRERLISRKLFPRHTDANVLWNGTVLRIRCYVKETPEALPRFAVVVSKKQYKTSASRNLLKRRVFSLIQNNLLVIDKFRFGKYIIFPKAPVEGISYDVLAQDIAALITQAS
jgi:ribonuclease P protein component